jgi:hypothetical protein
MVSERALRTRWNKRQADRRAYEAGLLRNEWDSLLSAVRGRLLMIVTDEGFRAGAMLAHRAAAVDQRGRQVGQRGQWHQVRQPPGRDGQEHRGARLSISTASGSWLMGSRSASRSGAWAEAAAGDARLLRSSGSAPSDPSAIAVPETRTAGGGNAVSQRGRPDAGAGRKARLHKDNVRTASQTGAMSCWPMASCTATKPLPALSTGYDRSLFADARKWGTAQRVESSVTCDADRAR